MKTGCVYLVGAGCGRADLITLRGMGLLQRCGAVVYDDLIDPALLELAPEDAERIYMGKRCGRHSAPQAEISARLVELARSGKTVVRLKGGDPFLFGRGGEEILALRAAGVPYEEVPGISSAIAIPAAAGIPVTHRGASQSLHIVTGHTAGTADALPAHLEELAHVEGTLVFLMGLSHLSQIAQRLVEAGRPASTPAAVVSGGNSPHPAAVRGTLSDIAQKAAAVQPPAVIVVGAVAALDLSPTLSRPLDGVRVGVTGTHTTAGPLCRSLEELGAQALWVARAVPVELSPDLDLRFLCSGPPRWVVFTSANGVELFFRKLARQKIDLRQLSQCRFAVIGPATGAALARHGLYPDLCPQLYTSRGLALALQAAAAPEEDILLFRSAQGSPVLPELLRSAGRTLRDLPAYDLRADSRAAQAGAQVLPALDYLVFVSAGGVDLFFQQYGGLPERAACVCIGEITAGALRRRTSAPILTAQEISVQGIVQTILETEEGKQKGAG